MVCPNQPFGLQFAEDAAVQDNRFPTLYYDATRGLSCIMMATGVLVPFVLATDTLAGTVTVTEVRTETTDEDLDIPVDEALSLEDALFF